MSYTTDLINKRRGISGSLVEGSQVDKKSDQNLTFTQKIIQQRRQGFQDFESSQKKISEEPIKISQPEEKSFFKKTSDFLGIGTGELKSVGEGIVSKTKSLIATPDKGKKIADFAKNTYNSAKEAIISSIEEDKQKRKEYYGEDVDLRKLEYDQVIAYETDSFLKIAEVDLKKDLEKLQSKKNKSKIDNYRIKNYSDTLAEIEATKKLSPKEKARKSTFVTGLALSRATGSITAGLLNIGESFFDFVKWRGDVAGTEKLSEFSEKAGDRIQTWAEEVRPNNPEFADKLLEGVGSTVPFYVTGLGVTSVAGRLASVSPKIASVIGVSSSAFMEAGLEAGSTYQDNIDRGMSHEEADKRASRVFAGNALFNFITDKVGLFSDSQGVKKIIVAGMGEGTQESWQNALQNLALDKPATENIGETFLLSFITGGSLGGFGEVIQDPAVRSQLNEEDLAKLDKVAKAIEESGGDPQKFDEILKNEGITKPEENAVKTEEGEAKTEEFSPTPPTTEEATPGVEQEKATEKTSGGEEAKKYDRTYNLNDKDDVEYLKRIFSDEKVEGFKNDDFAQYGKDRVEEIIKGNLIKEKVATPQEKVKDIISIKPTKIVENPQSFKTDEEFADAHVVYHGGDADFIKQLQEGKGFDPTAEREAGTGGNFYGLSTSTNYKMAKNFSGSATSNPAVGELYISPDAKVLDFEGRDGEFLDSLSEDEVAELAKKYDVIRDINNIQGENEVRILNPDVLVSEKDIKLPEVKPTKPTKTVTKKETTSKVQEKVQEKKKFTPKKVEKKKVAPFKASDRKKIQEETKNAVFSGNSQEENVGNIEKYTKEVLDKASEGGYEQMLKAVKAEMKRNMYELVGADTGNWKRDYAYFQNLRNNPEVSDIIDAIEESIFEIDEVVNPDAPPSVGGSLASSGGSQNIDEFENRSIPKKGTQEFKLFEKTQELIKKYARTIGEGYLPRKTLGVYYPQTKNIRVNAINNLSTVAHEITHFLDYQYKITDKLLAIKGFAKNGNPIYDPSTKKFRKEITEIYTKYYPGGKKTHKLRMRAEEGFATLLQKYIETPTKISREFPNIVNAFFKPGGQYYQPIMKDIIKDLNDIVAEYQGLSSLDKIGAKVTSDNVNIDKGSFLGFFDKVRTQLVDKLHPIEVLAKQSNRSFTNQDPSLWLRAFNGISGIVNNNISTDRGYWSLKGDNFTKVHEFNWRTLVDMTEKRKISDDFGFYLVARREYFSYKELDERAENVKRLKEQADGMSKEEMTARDADTGMTFLEEIKQAISDYKELKKVLANDGFSRKEVEKAYEENKERFQEEEKMFDTLTQEDIEFLASENVQLISPEKKEKLLSQQGYASFKRQFYDEVLGDHNEFPNSPRVGKTKVSSTIRRKGSQRTIINPLYSGIANHSEMMRKGLKQVVYNKIVDIGTSSAFPNLFQPQQLKSFVDPQSGAIIFPQERDPNIIMGRKNYKRTPVLVDQEVKTILDNTLTYENVETFQKLYVGLSRMFTAGTTGFYPAFAATNFMVDQITAMANTTNKYRPIYSAVKQFKDILKDKTGEDYKYYEEYLVMGGERQTFTGWQKLPPGQLFKAIKGEKSGLEKAISVMEKGTDILSTPAKYSEIVTRATEYVKARKAGKPQIVALEEAGRVTAPFHHIGNWGGKGGQTFIRGLPFFNASLQVLDQGIRTMETVEGRKRTGAVVAIITSAYLASILKLLRADDEQKEQYKDLSPKELAGYLYFPHPSGKKLIRVKISQSFSPLGVVMNMVIADNVMKTNYSAKDYMTASTAWLPDQFNPVDPIQSFLSWIPQVFSVGAETIFNVKTYPQVSPLESMSLQNLPPELRVNDNTSKFAKWLGGRIGMSPIKIDYLLTGYFGRSIGFATGQPSAYDFKSTVIRDYYFSGGRRVSGAYDIKEENDQKYTAYQRGELELSESEARELYRVKVLTNDFGEIMGDYRKIDIEKDPEKASELRNEAIQIINMIDNGDEPKKFNGWVKDAEKRRKKKLKELKKEGLTSDASTTKKKGFSLVKQAYASEIAFTGTERQEQIYDEMKSGYRAGEASYYNAEDPNQTRPGTDGTGAYGRKVEKGDVAFGNRVFHDRLKDGEIIYVKVKGMESVKTPYGNGVFRVNDTMNLRYNQKGKFNIDFHPDDLTEEQRTKGRFKIEWKIVEPEKNIKFDKPKDGKKYYA